MAIALAHAIRPSTLADARVSYATLKSAPCSDVLTQGRAGFIATDFFFLSHRLRAKTRRNISFVDAMKTPKIREHLQELVPRYEKLEFKSLTPDKQILHMYNVFRLYYGSVNQLRPLVAKHIYCILKPQIGILDFSMGWGGRCIAAMAMNIPYIGVDANRALEPAFNHMVKALEPSASTKLYFQPAETFNFEAHANTYDLVFTSPPYFTLERYVDMPKYEGRAGFMDTFFRPTVTRAWAGLATGGHLALNMPAAMYEAIRDLLPPLEQTISMPIQSRHPVGAAHKRTLGNEPRSELVYVWKKTSKNVLRSNKTRKVRASSK